MSIPPVRRWNSIALSVVVVLAACSGGGDDSTSSADTQDPPSAASVSSTGSDASSTITSTTITSTTTTSTTTTSTLPPTTAAPTTTTEPLVVDGAIVMVANSADVPGAAAELSAALAERGFVVREPTNGAIYDTFLEVTRIYAREEAAAVAASVSRLLGGIPVERMPTPVPIAGANETLGDATIVVMLGTDLAGTPLGG